MKISLISLAILVAACGDDGSGTTIDGGPGADTGPQGACNVEGGEFCFLEAGAATSLGTGAAANWACAADQIENAAAPIDVTGHAIDYQSGNDASGAMIDVFFSPTDFSTPDVSATADDIGDFSLTLPTGAPSRLAWRTQAADALDTYELNDPLDVSLTAATVERISIAESTANVLSLFISVEREPGTGAIVGVVRDCDREVVVHAVATLSKTSSVGDVAPDFVPAAQVYYFNETLDPSLPERRDQAIETTNGLFVIFQIPPTTAGETYFLQVWGYPQTAGGAMTLLAEFETVVLADSVIVIDMDPTEGPL